MLVVQTPDEPLHLDGTASENWDEQVSQRTGSHGSLLQFLFATYDTCVFCPGKFVG